MPYDFKNEFLLEEKEKLIHLFSCPWMLGSNSVNSQNSMASEAWTQQLKLMLNDRYFPLIKTMRSTKVCGWV